MKTLIKKYNHPQVDMNILKNTHIYIQEQNPQQSKIKTTLLVIQYTIILGVITLFIENLLFINVQNYGFFSSFNSLGIIFQGFIQIVFGTINFLMNNFVLMLFLSLLIYLLQFIQIKKY